jgi:hypothetical protein
VILLMAMKERFAGVVGEELDFYRGVGGNENHILMQASDFGAFLYAADFERVAVEMHGVIVHALVAEDEAIALTGL